jgi:hypothetical protein
MSRGPNFIDRDVFGSVIADVPRADGAEYEDVATLYGDMSRLVVAWLASTPPKKLAVLYTRWGWGGRANVRAIHLAATRWLELHHPEKIRDRFGNRAGTSAAAINAILGPAPRSVQQILEALKKHYRFETTADRVYSHLGTLRRKGLIVKRGKGWAVK